MNNAQFGYHTDTYFYSKYLKDEFAITYLCWDYGLERILESGVRITYVSRKGNMASRLARFILAAVMEMRANKYDIVFVVYFRLCFLLSLFGRAGNIVLDIRTGYVRSGALKRILFNRGIFLESLVFSRTTIITEDLRRDLAIPARKSHILPLGAETIANEPKDLTSMHLLYVGTFTNRQMCKTIEGFDMFAEQFKEKVKLSYDIVGFGIPKDEEELQMSIANAKHNDLIRFHGRVPYNKLKPYFADCNIGVAFIPLEDHFQSQPPTKVFEYLLSGMPVIATANRANSKIINEQNGVLIPDSAEGFNAGMREIYENLQSFDSNTIRSSSEKYSWSDIINIYLRKYLHTLASNC